MSKNQKITCPQCKAEISVDDVLGSQIEPRIRAEYETKRRLEEDAIREKEADLAKKLAQAEIAQKNADTLIAEKLKKQLAEKENDIRKAAKQEAESDQKQMLELLKTQLAEKDTRLQESRRQEVELLKKQTELEEKEKNFELEKIKQLNAEKAKYETKRKQDEDILKAKQTELEEKEKNFELEKIKQVNAEKAKYETKRKQDEDILKAKEADLEKKLAQAETAQKNADTLIAEKLKKQLAEKENDIRKAAKQEAESDQRQMLELLKTQLAEKDTRLQESRRQEVELLKKQTELEEKEKNFELEKIKQLNAEKAKIEEEASRKAVEASQTKVEQLQKQLSDVLKLNEDLRRKAEQGSQQSQGEVVELRLEETLREAFVYDEIQPVPKGVNGADIIQKVVSRTGNVCGKIIYEIKNTKNWSKSWIQKLKDDQRAVSADVAVIVSSALPDGITTFAFFEGVYVCDVKLAVPLAAVIRDKLEAITREKGLAIGKNEKMEILYQYLTGVQFKQRIEAILEAFKDMKTDLEKEKVYFFKKWAKTDQQIQKVISNTAGMYGDLDGMVTLPPISTLELAYEEAGGNTVDSK